MSPGGQFLMSLDSSMTPACFKVSGYLRRPTLPTTALRLSGWASRSHAVRVPRLGHPSRISSPLLRPILETRIRCTSHARLCCLARGNPA